MGKKKGCKNFTFLLGKGGKGRPFTLQLSRKGGWGGGIWKGGAVPSFHEGKEGKGKRNCPHSFFCRCFEEGEGGKGRGGGGKKRGKRKGRRWGLSFRQGGGEGG